MAQSILKKALTSNVLPVALIAVAAALTHDSVESLTNRIKSVGNTISHVITDRDYQTNVIQTEHSANIPFEHFSDELTPTSQQTIEAFLNNAKDLGAKRILIRSSTQADCEDGSTRQSRQRTAENRIDDRNLNIAQTTVNAGFNTGNISFHKVYVQSTPADCGTPKEIRMANRPEWYKQDTELSSIYAFNADGSTLDNIQLWPTTARMDGYTPGFMPAR